MPPPADPRFYYLANFHTVLDWLDARYADLLDADELAFIHGFRQLPRNAQALLVRLMMRKGPHFRASKLDYAEIGCPHEAAAPLLAAGWLLADAELDVDALAGLLLKHELAALFDPAPRRAARKAELLATLQASELPPRAFSQWCPELAEQLYSFTLGVLCERLRLMFFGNLHQDWSEFVLAELGILRYEQVPFSEASRGFASRAEIDAHLLLQRCREAFEAGAELAPLVEVVRALPCTSVHLQRRRERLLYHIGQQFERLAQPALAEQVYVECAHPAARHRRVRALEALGQAEQALALASSALDAPQDAAETQLMERAVVRLRRALGHEPTPRSKPPAPQRLDLQLLPAPDLSVEQCVQAHLNAPDAPVHYVENTLVCSLFGLLCWEAIFLPLPGAFFHPFHAGPADLLDPGFAARRQGAFDACLARLGDGSYRAAMHATYQAKHGLQSPFVYWELLDEALLQQALDCLPAAHLEAWFRRLLQDIAANRAGMPALIQFHPAERGYRMIEVKGPGDRLQDNQKRWLSFCAEHGMPVSVCYVTWSDVA
ncbi:MAG: Fanconi-associated nuclease 1 [Stenotrophomonas maltophilia]|nr:MAG: Fanconi-associated nuclease 1 [Stenotrophomonas maltophilia]